MGGGESGQMTVAEARGSVGPGGQGGRAGSIGYGFNAGGPGGQAAQKALAAGQIRKQMGMQADAEKSDLYPGGEQDGIISS